MRPLFDAAKRASQRAFVPAMALLCSYTAAAWGAGYTHYLTNGRVRTAQVAEAGSTIKQGPQASSVRVAPTAPIQAPAPTVAKPKPKPPAAAFADLTGSQPRVESWIHRLTTSLKSDVEVSLQRMNKYSDMITAKLDARGMPHDLIYLAMIESRFNPTAKSHASAVGMWQFMASTARRYGLKVGGGVDQRKDPAASTDAALTYLSSLHDKFGSWYLAAAAYNAGEGAVAHALKSVTGRTTGTDADFFKILPKLPKETRDYVPKLIATAHVSENAQHYGINTDDGE